MKQVTMYMWFNDPIDCRMRRVAVRTMRDVSDEDSARSIAEQFRKANPRYEKDIVGEYTVRVQV